MCGIAGILNYGDRAEHVDQHELIHVRDAMRSRGPEDAGLWVSPDGRVGLAHRRLSIIDLSDAGAQPMATPDGRYWIVFNGEIYNYRQLRANLEQKGYTFRSGSDTEVLLSLYAAKGSDMVSDLRGMFAFALWDESKQGLLLARDHLGIKPLYYSDNGHAFRFASQVKALLAGGAVDTAHEPAGHVGFFLWGHVPEPYTLYRGIRALPAGTTLWIHREGRRSFRQYWSLHDRIGAGDAHVGGGDQQALRSALLDSVKAHMVADVPVGLFLSAGLDSATLLGLASEEVKEPIRTITLAFDEYRGISVDEGPLAETVASHYGANHTTCRVTGGDFQGERARLLQAMDQPTVDGVNTYFVSKVAAASGLKVALSGLGADELFGGYPSFRQIPNLVRKLGPLRTFPWVGKSFRWLSAPLLKRVTSPKYAGILEYGPTFGGAYLLRRGLYMPWELDEVLDPDLVRQGWRELQPLLRLEEVADRIGTDHWKVAALEMSFYMRNQLLRDSDWAGMAHSLEIRVPFVDVRLLEQIGSLSQPIGAPCKRDMASTPGKPLPSQLFKRAKTGFSIPVHDWLAEEHGAKIERGLKGWAKVVYASALRP